MKKTQREYKVIDFPPLTAEDRAVLDKLDEMPDSEINYEDIPQSAPDSTGGFYYFQSLKIPKPDITKKVPKPISDRVIISFALFAKRFFTAILKIVLFIVSIPFYIFSG